MALPPPRAPPGRGRRALGRQQQAGGAGLSVGLVRVASGCRRVSQAASALKVPAAMQGWRGCCWCCWCCWRAGEGGFAGAGRDGRRTEVRRRSDAEARELGFLRAKRTALLFAVLARLLVACCKGGSSQGRSSLRLGDRAFAVPRGNQCGDRAIISEMDGGPSVQASKRARLEPPGVRARPPTRPVICSHATARARPAAVAPPI